MEGQMALQKEDGRIQRSSVLEGNILEPQKLKILILSGTEIIGRELESISLCVNLLKLDLSNNSIRFLPKSLQFSNFSSLKLLYLHNNLMEEIEPLYKIFEIPNLRYLTLFNNPLSSKWSLRHFIVNSIPSLFALDFHVISDEERMEQAVKTSRFHALSQTTKIIWPIVSKNSQKFQFKNQSTDGYKGGEQNIPKSGEDDEYLQILREELRVVTSKFAENSPSLIIQRVWRGYKCRKDLQRKIKTAEERLEISEKVAGHWKKQTARKIELKQLLIERGKGHLLYENKLFQFHKGKAKITEKLKQFIINFRFKKKWMVSGKIVLKAFLRMKAFLNSYEPIFRKTSGAISQQFKPRIYFQKGQIELFKKILATSIRFISFKDTKILDFHHDLMKNINSYLKSAEDVLGLRMAESRGIQSQAFHSKYPFNALSRPSLHSRVLLLPPKCRYYKMQDHPFLKKFRRQVTIPSCALPSREALLSKEGMKKHKKLNERLTYFQLNAYESLYEIEFADSQLAIAFSKAVFTHNLTLGNGRESSNKSNFITQIPQEEEEGDIQKYHSRKKKQHQSDNFQKEIFLVFFRQLFERVSAAITIQKVWRKILCFKSGKGYDVFERILQIRASLRIQHWFRNLRWRHRRSFFSRLSYYLRGINSLSLYIHMGVYKQFSQIIKETRSESIFSFREQQSKIMVNFQSKQMRILPNLKNPQNSFLNYLLNPNKHRLFPKWIGLQGKHEDKQDIQEKEVDAFHLLHYNTTCSIAIITGMQYLKIEFPSVEEAKYRAAALALLTYKFWSNCFFVKLYNFQEIQAFSFILQEETDIKLTFNIDLPYNKRQTQHHIETPINNSSSFFISGVHNKENFIPVDSNHKQVEVSAYFTLPQSQQKQPSKIQTNFFIIIFPNLYSYIHPSMKNAEYKGMVQKRKFSTPINQSMSRQRTQTQERDESQFLYSISNFKKSKARTQTRQQNTTFTEFHTLPNEQTNLQSFSQQDPPLSLETEPNQQNYGKIRISVQNEEGSNMKIPLIAKKEKDIQIISIEKGLHRVEVLRQISAQTKNEEQWNENLCRSSNFLMRQITSLNKQKAKDQVLARNTRKAQAIRIQKREGNFSVQQSAQQEESSSQNYFNTYILHKQNDDQQLQQISKKPKIRYSSVQHSQRMNEGYLMSIEKERNNLFNDKIKERINQLSTTTAANGNIQYNQFSNDFANKLIISSQAKPNPISSALIPNGNKSYTPYQSQRATRRQTSSNRTHRTHDDLQEKKSVILPTLKHEQ